MSDCRTKILSNDYVDYIIDFAVDESVFGIENPDYCYQQVEGDIGVLHVTESFVGASSVNLQRYSYIPTCYGIAEEGSTVEGGYDFNALEEAGILSISGEPLNLTGRGVIIGFVDTGIRYALDVFRRQDGSSRILSIWDQTIQSGTAPAGFEYGTEYSHEEIEAALYNENPLEIVPTTDEIGHGTKLASVAAGSVLAENNFRGAAPDVSIIMVKLKTAKPYLKEYYAIPEDVPSYSETDIMMGIKYLLQFVVTFSRPIIICIGLGTNFGNHTGNDIFSRYLVMNGNQRSVGVVVGGGNEGNSGHHYEGAVTLPTSRNWEDVEIRVEEGQGGFVVELWGQIPYVYSVAITSPTGESIPQISYRLGMSNTYSFIYSNTEVTVEYALVAQVVGEQLVWMRFVNPTPGIWTIRVYADGETGEAGFHMWLPINTFQRPKTEFLRPNPYITITEPGYARDIFVVNAYNGQNDSFYVESGRGFARNNQITPTLSATGVNIPTVLGRSTGSDMALAITAGALADFYQWAVVERNDPLANTRTVKNYFIRGADRSSNIAYPNREWGYGRLDLMGVFDSLAR